MATTETTETTETLRAAIEAAAAATSEPDYEHLAGSHYTGGHGVGGVPVASRMYANFPTPPHWQTAADVLRRK